MGTTLTMAYCLDAQLCVVHVGDSRAYIFEDDALEQITHDHTLMAEMLRQGTLRPEEAARHRLRNVITNVVGGNEAGVNVESHALEVHAGDRLLLCSDGLTEMLTNDAIAAVLRAEPQPQAACTKLVAHANDAGGRDNITALVVRFD
jgi:protein phosphatase